MCLHAYTTTVVEQSRLRQAPPSGNVHEKRGLNAATLNAEVPPHPFGSIFAVEFVGLFLAFVRPFFVNLEKLSCS